MEKKNMLVISDNFLKGGLERHILNQFIDLKHKFNYVFLFEKYMENNTISDEKIYQINQNGSVNNFIRNVQKIVEIIESENIDIIHIHPFKFIFPAMIAGQITQKPILYTIHGIGSLNFYNDINIEIMYKIFLEYCSPTVITVDNDYSNVLKYKFLAKNVKYIPNSIDSSLLKNTKCKYNNKWLLISRLDIDKMEVAEVLKILNKLDITLDIIGDGTKRRELEDLATELNIDDKVEFKGYKDDIVNEIAKGYNGVIGIGQVVLEGLCANLPVLLIGYNKITGLIDKVLFDKIKENNFINKQLGDYFNVDEFKNINNNIEKYQFQQEIIDNYDIKIINKKYSKVLSEVNFCAFDYLVDFYNDLIETCNKDYDLYNDDFSNSEKVFELLKKYIYCKITDPNIINVFDTHQKLLETKQIEAKLSLIDFKLDNIGLTEVSKRTLRNLNKFLAIKLYKPKLYACMCVRNEEYYLDGFLKSIENYVDGIVVVDDGSTDNTKKILKDHSKVKKVIENQVTNKLDWDEAKNREIVIREAKKAGADYVLCCDPDERFEINFLENIRSIIKNKTFKTYSLHVREMWNSYETYRYDGIWAKKRKAILFPVSNKMTFNYDRNHHIPWYYKELENKDELLNYNLYHMKMLKKDEREKRKKLYKKIDPNNEMQPIGYEYLTDETDILICPIESNKEYDYTTLPKDIQKNYKYSKQKSEI